MNTEAGNSPETVKTKFETTKQAIRDIAKLGEHVEGTYVEVSTYNLELDGLSVEVYDAFSYWPQDSGPTYGVSLNYKTPGGKQARDWLGFVGRSHEPTVQLNGEDRREATEEDLMVFESVLLHAKNVAEQKV